MRYFIAILLIFSLPKITFSQVKLSYLEIINSSTKLTYIGLNYQPDYNLFRPDFEMISRGLATLSQRYEANFKVCKNEYQKLMNLKLINNNNIQVLTSYQTAVERWAKESFHKFDLSQQQNTNNVLAYITNAFKVQSIKDEIEILQAVSDMYNLVPTASPVIGCQKIMYNNIDKFCDELKNYNSYQLSQGFSKLFNDFMDKRNEKQKEINEVRKAEILNKYAINRTFRNISDGWQEAEYISVSPIPLFEGSNKSWHYTGKMKVYVSKNRVTQIIKADGSAINIDISNPILKQKVDILFPEEKCADGSMIKIPYTLYF